MLGNLAGQWIATKRPLTERLNGLFAAGALGMMAGLMWNWSFPINKSLWTSSYVVFCAGMAASRSRRSCGSSTCTRSAAGRSRSSSME